MLSFGFLFWVEPATVDVATIAGKLFVRFFVGRLCETARRLTQTPYNSDSRFSILDSRNLFLLILVDGFELSVDDIVIASLRFAALWFWTAAHSSRLGTSRATLGTLRSGLG